jgi:hypothetical protein
LSVRRLVMEPTERSTWTKIAFFGGVPASVPVGTAKNQSHASPEGETKRRPYGRS